MPPGLRATAIRAPCEANTPLAGGWTRWSGVCTAARPPAPSEDESLRWQHVVISLQMLLELPLIVGGRTALELQGFAHYLSATGPREIHLYGDEPPPAWVGKLKLE